MSTDQVAAAGTRHPSRLARPAIGWLHWAGLGPALPHQHQSHAPTHHTTPGDLLSCQNTQQQSSAYLLPAPRCRGGVKESCNFWETESGCRGCLALPGAAWPRLLETFHSSAFIRQLPVTDTPGAGAPAWGGDKIPHIAFLSNNNIKRRAIDKFNIIEPKCAVHAGNAVPWMQFKVFLMQPFLRWRSL